MFGGECFENFFLSNNRFKLLKGVRYSFVAQGACQGLVIVAHYFTFFETGQERKILTVFSTVMVILSLTFALEILGLFLMVLHIGIGLIYIVIRTMH